MPDVVPFVSYDDGIAASRMSGFRIDAPSRSSAKKALCIAAMPTATVANTAASSSAAYVSANSVVMRGVTRSLRPFP